MRINYFVSETVMNLRRNFLMTIAAISTVAISLLLLGGVQILGMVVGNMTNTWEAKVEVSVYLRDNATQGEIQALQRDIDAMPEVKDTIFLSEADALDDFKQQFSDRPELWESLRVGDLPASFRIALHDANDSEQVADAIEGAPGVEGSPEFGGQIIKRLLQVNSLLRTVTLAMSIILMIASAALIANTIRVAIYARREEIGIMKLVGATNWFIRIPFMFEGMFAAFMGAAIAGGIVLITNALVFSRIGGTIPFLGQVFTFSSGELGGVMLVLVGVGTLVGLIGSGMALRRFLEV